MDSSNRGSKLLDDDLTIPHVIELAAAGVVERRHDVHGDVISCAKELQAVTESWAKVREAYRESPSMVRALLRRWYHWRIRVARSKVRRTAMGLLHTTSKSKARLWGPSALSEEMLMSEEERADMRTPYELIRTADVAVEVIIHEPSDHLDDPYTPVVMRV